jgi:1,4-dihydroxy-2-naphthoate octaprenyltransferase
MSAQLSVHFSNDYFDADTDKPGGGTLISGGDGVLLEHPELRESVKRIAVGLTVFSIVMGILLVRIYSYSFSVMGYVVLGNLAGWSYSAPPFRFSDRGLGELCYAFIAGFLVPSMGYLVMKGKLDWNGIFFLVPLMFYGLASILSVEIPDVEDDRAGNKQNWVARLGRGFGFGAIGWSLLAATVYFFLLPGFYSMPLPVDLRVLGLFSLLPAGVGLFGVWRKPLEREAATKIAVGVIISLVMFALLVDSYLFSLAIWPGAK